MSKETPITLKMAEDEPVIAWTVGDRFQRELAFDEKEEQDSLILFPNIDSITTLMLAYEGFSFPPMAPAFGVSIDAGEGNGPMAHMMSRLSDVSNPNELIAPFGNTPTASKINKAKRALKTWRHESEFYSLLPLRDCIAASRDLKNLLSVLLFSVGSCSLENLKKTLEAGFVFRDKQCNGCEAYANHVLGLGDISVDVLRGDFALFDVSKKIPDSLAVFGCDEETIKSECGEYSSYAINTFMHTVHPKIEDGRFLITGRGNSIGSAYAFWAELALSDKAAVCEHCGNLFVRRRNTKRYCSDSCKVSASLARASHKE